MSRNKDIQFYHKVSGLSYKECRANLKAVHWDLGAIFFPKLHGLTESMMSFLDSFKPLVRATADACVEFADSLKKALQDEEVVKHCIELHRKDC